MANNRPTRGGTLNGYKILSIVLAALLAAVAIVELVLWRLDYIVFQNPNAQEQTVGTQDGMLLTPGNSERMTMSVSRALAANGEETVTLTATITPENATNKQIDWSVAWSDASASWANGKTVTDYVTVTPTSDGAASATVKNLQAFGAKIKVIASSREDPEITAECTVDYAQRCPSPLFSATGLSVPNHGLDSDLMSFNKDSKNLTMRLYPDWTETGKRKITFSNTFMTYTVSDTFTATYGLRQSQDLKTALSLYGIVGAEYTDVTDDFTPNQELFEDLFEGANGDSEKMNDLITCLANCDTHYTLEVRIKGKYSEESFDIPLKINTSEFIAEVNGVELDQEEIVF